MAVCFFFTSMDNSFMKKGRKYTLKEQVSDLKSLLRNRDALIETYEHGGARKGAGRKPKEPTKTIRVPLSKLAAVLKAIGKA